MNEDKLRKKAVVIAQSYLGATQGSAAHKKIIDTFNKVKPDGWKMTYTAAWCATFASADAILAFGVDDAKKYFPLSANCPRIIEKAKAVGMWVEKDSYVPKPGDWILYDWDDSGKGNNTGSPDHVGIVEKATKEYITVIEGNFSTAKKVGRRTIEINGRYIRGFVVPMYKTLAAEITERDAKKAGKAMVDLATKQLGNGYKKYCKAFGKNTSWCQIFMWWLADKKDLKYLKDSFARHAAKWAKKHWEHVTMKEARAGDFVFFTSKAKGRNKMVGKVTHVGLIRAKGKVEKDGKVITCRTIEGNVKAEGSKSPDWRKHVVAKRTRGLNYVWGIFRPPYGDK
jgi:hypothetical protein